MLTFTVVMVDVHTMKDTITSLCSYHTRQDICPVLVFTEVEYLETECVNFGVPAFKIDTQALQEE